jgi:hypothetical protein
MQKITNQRWLVARQLEKIKNAPAVNINLNIGRRTFLTIAGVSLANTLLPSCSKPGVDVISKTLIQETEFQYFIDVVFPAHLLGLESLREPTLKRLQRLNHHDALLVSTLYQQFKHQLWKNNLILLHEYSLSFGEKCLADILQSSNSEQHNKALDIIYLEMTRIKAFSPSIWDRKLSLYDKKCAYWNNYDIKPIS